jgi:hypothetical protein
MAMNRILYCLQLVTNLSLWLGLVTLSAKIDTLIMQKHVVN